MISKWPVVELGDVVNEITVGFVGSMVKEYVETGIPFLRSKNIIPYGINWNDMRYINENFHSKLKKSVLRTGDVVIVRTGKPGTTCVIPNSIPEANCSDAVIVRVDNDKLSAHFLSYFMNSNATHQVNSFLVGAVQQHFNVGAAKKIIIPLPNREEQEAIVKILNSINDRIQLNRKTNKTLEHIAQAIFKSWFVDFEPVKAKITAKQVGASPNQIECAAMCAISGKTEEQLNQLSHEIIQQLKSTATLFPDAMVESELGEIPKGWDCQRMEDVIELAYGKALKKTDRIKGTYPVYGSGGLTGTHNTFLVNKPGIIIGRKGTIGRIYWSDEDYYPIDTVFYVKCKKPMTLQFSFYLLQTLGLDSMNTDAAVPGLNRNNVYRLNIPSFPKELVDAYTVMVDSFRSKIKSSNDETRSLTSIRDTLLPKLLSGELSVNKAN